MREIKLRPIPESRREVDSLEKYLLHILKKYVYYPLSAELGTRGILENSKKYLVSEIKSGSIRYVDTGFVGKMSASVSKQLKDLGAKWDSRELKWNIPVSKLPSDITNAINTAAERDREVKTRLANKLDSINPIQIGNSVKPKKNFSNTIKDMNAKVSSSFKDAGTLITVTPTLSDSARDRIFTEYSSNLQVAVKDFTEKEVLNLRAEIEQHVFKGNRYEDLLKYLTKSFSVSKRKAQFLARQETNLLTAKVKELRYQDAGVDDYEWRCVAGSGEHPVRPIHKALDKTRHKFSSPPVTNKQGGHNNPGEDYNCRCSAIPILKV